jgi:DNA-directed RNA polymerase specialized sigma24 family protein
VSAVPPIILSDRACLEAWRRHPSRENFRPLLERYGAFVYSSACRQTGHAEDAAEVTRAVFLVLARQARKLRTRTVLAGWLFHVATVASGKTAGVSRRAGWRRWFQVRRKHSWPSEATVWDRVAAEIDEGIARLSPARRDAVVLRLLLNRDRASIAATLGTTDPRAGRRVRRGLAQLTRWLRKRGAAVDEEMLAQVCPTEGSAQSPPEELTENILALVEAGLTNPPSLKLARRTWQALAWARWWRRVALGVPSLMLLLATLGGAAWYVDSLSGHSRLISAFLIWSVKHEARTVPGLMQRAQAWPPHPDSPRLNAAGLRAAADLYRTTNVWLAHLHFARESWEAAQPKRIDPLPHFLQPDGTVLLRHPEAQRSGLAGVLGFDFHWARADIEFGGVAFTNVAARIKGNGTYLGSLYGDKCPFKVDLNKFTKGQKLAGTDELTFNNLVNDHSCLSDALAYEFFRQAGVPAPRTAYAYLSVSVDGQWERKPLGLYVMVEAVDEDFALEQFGSKRAPIFKPVTYELFHHLGDDWPAYETIYDLKTQATAAQQRRVIDFARLVTHADDAEFARQVGAFLDLDRFARYLACEVLLSNYDGFLSNGQNFYLYLDPVSNQFGFIPWDLDLSWGGFFLLGTTRERERASIWHPWVGRNRFLERVMAVEAFQQRYREQLEDLLARRFVPGLLHQRVDEMAGVLRGPIAAESAFRLGKFEQAVGLRPQGRASGRSEPKGANRPAHQIKRFIDARARSVREQLDGKSEGVILKRAQPR